MQWQGDRKQNLLLWQQTTASGSLSALSPSHISGHSGQPALALAMNTWSNRMGRCSREMGYTDTERKRAFLFLLNLNPTQQLPSMPHGKPNHRRNQNSEKAGNAGFWWCPLSPGTQFYPWVSPTYGSQGSFSSQESLNRVSFMSRDSWLTH